MGSGTAGVAPKTRVHRNVMDEHRNVAKLGLERLRRAEANLAASMKRDPTADHVDAEREMVAAVQLCDAVAEAIRAASLLRWPSIAGSRAAEPYHDVVDGELTIAEAIKNLHDRTDDAITFWTAAIRDWPQGRGLLPSLRKLDFGWVQYVMVAVQDCQAAVQRMRAGAGAL